MTLDAIILYQNLRALWPGKGAWGVASSVRTPLRYRGRGLANFDDFFDPFLGPLSTPVSEADHMIGVWILRS